MGGQQFYYLLLQIFLLVAAQRTELDSPANIAALRIFRRWIYEIFGKTGVEGGRNYQLAKNRGMIQEEIPSNVPFPCDVRGGRSAVVPDSVHRLRPGDIDVIAVMGDSYSAGAGSFGTNVGHVLIENRGVTPAAGGQGNWRKYLTLANILKEYNPNLIGYALGDSLVTEIDTSQLNVAESAATSDDMPFMAEYLVSRMKKDPRINIEKDWKLITFSIGTNNFCSFMCERSSPATILDDHKNDLIKTLRILRDNLPRTFVNIHPPPHVRHLWPVFNEADPSSMCRKTLSLECSCIFTLVYRNRLQEYFEIMERWQDLEEEISTYPEFHTNDFTVEFQPIFRGKPLLPKINGLTDSSYLSADCFHLSQKYYSRLANAMWNNLLEPVGKKTLGWSPNLMEKFLCSNSQKPFLATQMNSRESLD